MEARSINSVDQGNQKRRRRHPNHGGHDAERGAEKIEYHGTWHAEKTGQQQHLIRLLPEKGTVGDLSPGGTSDDGNPCLHI